VLHEAAHKLLEVIARTKVEEASRALEAETTTRSRAALDAREAELEVSRQSTAGAEEAAEKAQNAAFLADNEVRTHEAEITRSRDRLRHLDERRVAAGMEQVDLARSLEGILAETVELESRLSQAEHDEANEAEVALSEHDRLEELRRGQSEAERGAGQLRTRAGQAAATVAGAQATLQGFERRVTELRQRRVRLEDELGRLVYDLEEVDARRRTLASSVTELAEGKRMSAEERTRLDQEMRELREAAVLKDRAVEQIKNEHGQKRNRLRALEELHSRLEGVGAGAKHILRSGDASVLGLVADRIEAPAELTKAFAGLLGERLQWIVTKDMDRGIALLADLARQNRGRATLVTARAPFVAGSTGRVSEEASELGALGRLADRLVFDAADEGLVRSLVGETLYAKTAEDALAVARACAGTPVVSLDGTVVSPEGRVSGGAGDAVAAGMIEQKREIRELHEVVSRLGEEVTRLLAEQQALRVRMGEVGTALERARTEAHQGELALVTAEKDLRRAEEQVTGFRRREDTVRGELEEMAEALERANDEERSAKSKLDEGRRLETSVADELVAAEVAATSWRDRVLTQQSIVTERKVLLARVRERAKGVRDTVERLKRSSTELSGRIKKLDDDGTEAAVQGGRAAASIVLAREALVTAAHRAHRAHEALTQARKALDETRHALASREADLKGLRAEVSSATERLRGHEMALSRLAIEETHVVEGVREKFRGLELHRVVGDFHKRSPVDDGHRARIVELAELLDRMGPVNLDAVREHAEAEERFTYYRTQKEDLDRAIADLEKAILQMNRESKRLFRQTFEGVNARFKMLFPKMFRGGSAELRLTNPDDMLETGIEILAQPPGKKLANIELMSGGEKALTAVSLIFAIFQYKPSPFCILDEVDAPLDEANVARYNEAIRGMTSHSQFILITHIKRTMQSVDVLYGVTMQEPGVSRVVSVRVNETGAQRSERVKAQPQQVAVA
jgi:chromosome segregation protein